MYIYMSSQKNDKEIMEHKMIYDSFFDILQKKSININGCENENENENNDKDKDKNKNNNDNKDNKKNNDFENKKRIERESEKKVNELLRGLIF